MKINNNTRNYILIVIILMCVFEDPISLVIPSFKYLDEILAIIALVSFVVNLLLKGGKIKINKKNLLIFVCFVLFCASGIVGFLLNSKQSMIACLMDLFLNLKFFLCLYLGKNIISKMQKPNIGLIQKVSELVTVFLTSLLLFNYLVPVFEGQEMRFGIQIPKLFFSHSSVLASIGIFLLALSFAFYSNLKHRKIIFLQLFIIFASFRYKAMATALVSIFVYIVVIVQKKKLRFYHYLVVFVGVLIIAWDQITIYYMSGLLSNARVALASVGIIIANNYFPFGTGFGSYGSYMSKVYYSDVYYQYGLNNVYGLSNSPGSESFISDTFWPMILGQTGYLGIIAYIIILLVLFSSINKKWKINKDYYMSSMVLLCALIIDSTSSSAFVGSYAVLYAIWLGVMMNIKLVGE